MSVTYLIPVRFECDGTPRHMCAAQALGTAACIEDLNDGRLKVPLMEPPLPPGWSWLNGALQCPKCASET